MLKRLRAKFVAMVMAVVAVILVVMFATISVITVQQAASQIDRDMNAAIDMAAEAQRAPGLSPDVPEAPRAPLDEADARLGGELASAEEGPFEPPEIAEAPGRRLQSPVAVYALEGGSLSLASRSGAALDADTLAAVSAQCASAPEGTGSLPEQGLVYMKRDAMGATYVAFADDAAAESLRKVLAMSAGVGAAALLLFLLVAVAFSRWALAPVQAAWERQREFVTNASHELKTPLSIVKANTEVMLDEPDGSADERRRWLLATKEATEGLQGLVDDMLALASIDELEGGGRASVRAEERAPIDASRVVEGCILKFESRAFEGGFVLDYDVEEGLAVRADKADLARLADILLDNACKYVGPGGTVRAILSGAGTGTGTGTQVRAGAGAPTVSFVVSNTGPTIPPERLARVFDRFYRVDAARDTTQGHGLGLSLAKALSDQMGAQIHAASSDGLTTFGFTLPAAEPGAPPRP